MERFFSRTRYFPSVGVKHCDDVPYTTNSRLITPPLPYISVKHNDEPPHVRGHHLFAMRINLNDGFPSEAESAKDAWDIALHFYTRKIRLRIAFFVFLVFALFSHRDIKIWKEIIKKKNAKIINI